MIDERIQRLAGIQLDEAAKRRSVERYETQIDRMEYEISQHEEQIRNSEKAIEVLRKNIAKTEKLRDALK